MSRNQGSGRRGGIDPAAEMAAGLASHRAGQIAAAVAHYDRVLAADRRHPGATHLKGVALLQSNDLAGAEELLARAVKLNPKNAPAHSDRGVCLMRLGRAADAVVAFAAALRLVPEAADVHANQAHALSLLGRHAEALAGVERALALAPGRGELEVHRAAMLSRCGRHAEALVAVGRVLTHAPGHPLALKVKGDVSAALGRGEDAVACYDEAITAAPDFVDARLARAGYRLGRGEAASAFEDFDRALAALPGLAQALAGRGVALVLLERPLEALADLRAAIDAGAGDGSTFANLATALVACGRHEDALVAAEQATAREPGLATAWLARGNALAGLGRLTDAVESYEKAAVLDPTLVDALYEKASTFRRLDRRAEAVAACEAVLAIAPGHFEARWLKAFVTLPAVAETVEELQSSRVTLETGLADLEAHAEASDEAWRAVGRIKPFYLTYQEQDNRRLLERYGALCVQLMDRWRLQKGIAAGVPAKPAGQRRLRVGIVSSEFMHHSIWTAIIKGWVLGLDRERFELHLFHTGDDQDAQTAIAREHATSFEQGRRNLEAWVAAIGARKLDALIYPDIGIDPVSLRLACLRLAPVQATSWGHPDTSGLPTMDAYLSGAAFEPEDAEAFYSERLVRLPGCGSCYRRLAIEPVAFDPAAFGLPADRPLLVSPGTPFKYGPAHDGVLVEIARRLGQCTIVMFEPAAEHRALFDKLRERLVRAFAAEGLAFDEHVRVLKWLKAAEFHGLMTRADAFLDTIGFSGFNTAMQAIECGLPIVTREGRFLRGRLASALYREMGMANLIAADEAAYVEQAVRLATEPAWRAEVRARIVAARDRLFDDERPVRALERWLVERCDGT